MWEHDRPVDGFSVAKSGPLHTFYTENGHKCDCDIFSFPQESANEKEARGLLKSAVER